MQSRSLAGVLALGLSGGACLVQPSLHPLIPPGGSTEAPQLVGHWLSEPGPQDPGDERIELLIQATNAGDYEVLLSTEGHEPARRLLVRFGRLGGELLWDATTDAPEDKCGLWSAHLLPVHAFARLRYDGDERLELAFVDPDWVEDALGSGTLLLDHEKTESGLVLTAPTEDLRRALADYAGLDAAFSDRLVFRKVPGPAEPQDRAAGLPRGI